MLTLGSRVEFRQGRESTNVLYRTQGPDRVVLVLYPGSVRRKHRDRGFYSVTRIQTHRPFGVTVNIVLYPDNQSNGQQPDSDQTHRAQTQTSREHLPFSLGQVANLPFRSSFV